ncbi:inositol monophosphatase [Fusibacter paucivorans]|uniref:Inositol-1-monophosphatase n=1 Tax=Fusibacter paucivorans TaxID=76009 RepID=A0ABS5PT52_9FIRM|nr:inositol monophosphatase family protein [Fusibacter paucivorans]MBS7528052.1 inositol monophosphatase [Fusibacter paucivorans]
MQVSAVYVPIIELIREVGAYQKAAFISRAFDIHTKSSAVDLVTEIDLWSDQKLAAGIRSLFPNDRLLTEEQGGFEGKNTYEWIVDPLDGTTNFSIGHPIFAISVARWQEDRPIFGAVYLPMLDILYTAERGKGAYQDDRRLTASKQTALVKSVLGTGFPYDRATAVNNNGENIRKMVPKVKGLRRLGAAAYDLCLVASGVYDAFWELRLAKWDLAAGRLMIEEAGGTFIAACEADKYNVIAGSKALCEQLSLSLNMRNDVG